MSDETRTLKLGDPAPDFTLRGTGNNTFTLSEQRGKNVMIAFFPAAFSGVCSQQMPKIQEAKAAFGDDTVPVAISVDNNWSQQAWAQQMGIDFMLLSDFWPHGAVAEKFGVLHQAGVAERALIGIDKEGIVRHIDVGPFTEIPDTEACLVTLKG
ncbi:MAG: redoxin domain-containing protein [Dehalococcoidia bacterium]